jgi:hypothetical protein
LAISARGTDIYLFVKALQRAASRILLRAQKPIMAVFTELQQVHFCGAKSCIRSYDNAMTTTTREQFLAKPPQVQILHETTRKVYSEAFASDGHWLFAALSFSLCEPINLNPHGTAILTMDWNKAEYKLQDSPQVLAMSAYVDVAACLMAYHKWTLLSLANKKGERGLSQISSSRVRIFFFLRMTPCLFLRMTPCHTTSFL